MRIKKQPHQIVTPEAVYTATARNKKEYICHMFNEDGKLCPDPVQHAVYKVAGAKKQQRMVLIGKNKPKKNKQVNRATF